jgi:hypothetical protein
MEHCKDDSFSGSLGLTELPRAHQLSHVFDTTKTPTSEQPFVLKEAT